MTSLIAIMRCAHIKASGLGSNWPSSVYRAMYHPPPPAPPPDLSPLTAVDALLAAFIDPTTFDRETRIHRDLFEDVDLNHLPQPGPVLVNSLC